MIFSCLEMIFLVFNLKLGFCFRRGSFGCLVEDILRLVN